MVVNTMTPEKSIFKAYDIRGIVGKTLTPEVTYAVGLVLGSMARDAGIDSLCVGPGRPRFGARTL